MQSFVADFETLTTPDKTRIWAFGHCEIGNVENFHYGTTMEEFFDWCRQSNKLVFFHNLKFDGEFLIYWLLTNGFDYSKDKTDNTFNCIISDSGQFYEIEVIFKKMKKKYKKVTFRDSHKKLPFSVKAIAKAFKLPIGKLEVPEGFYDWERPVGHELTDLEVQYLKQDVQVVALALGIQFDQELTRMTIGSDSIGNYKKMLGDGDYKQGERNFRRMFPLLPWKIDNDIRQAYKGGFTYVNKLYAGRSLAEGIVYDVNSLYPSVMYDSPLPYGMPISFKGKYKSDDYYPLYVQRLTCEFELKPDHIPTIQLKNSSRFVDTEYLVSSRDKLGNREVTLTLTSVDMELFFEHYDVTPIAWEGGWKFKQCVGEFKDYIDHWTAIKIANSKEKNALYTLAKLMLNSLYGKFATNPDVTGKYPVINEKTGAVQYIKGDDEIKDPIYTAMGAFITAWARYKTITTAQSVYDRFIYADTDSIHLIGTEQPDIDIHDNELGKWACEGEFERARFLRAKTYIEQFDGDLHVTCAGMPDNVKDYVTWDNFHLLNEDMLLPARDGYWFGKLSPKHVPGGIVLEPSTFTLS